MDIKEAIEKLANTHDVEYVNILKCEVISVSDTEIVCKPVNSKIASEIIVPLLNLNGNTISCTPSIESIVLVAITNKNLITLLSVDDADEINISANLKIEFNGGEFGGLVKINELLEKINNLENLLNDLIVKYNTHTHAVSGAVAIITTLLETESLIPTMLNEIENENITHGI